MTTALYLMLLLGTMTSSTYAHELMDDDVLTKSLETVKSFVSLDYKGYRLDSRGHQAIWELTLDDGMPSAYPQFLVTSYRVGTPQKKQTGVILVPVDYEVIGVFSEGPKFKYQTFVDRELFPVRCEGTTCKIDLNREIFRVTPHVGKDATLFWLKELKGIQNTPRAKQAIAQLSEHVKNAK